jgi:hypothetical protein
VKEPQNSKLRYILLATVGAVLLWYQSLGFKSKVVTDNINQSGHRNENKTEKKKSKTDKLAKKNKVNINNNKQIVPVSSLNKIKVKRSKSIIRNVANNKKAKLASKSYRGKYDYYFEETFEMGDSSFQISSNLVTEPLEEGSKRVPLFRVGNFNVYEEEIENPLGSHQRARIIYNSSTKKYAVLTGLVFIRFEKKLEKDKIEDLLPVTVKETIDHLNFSIVIPNEGTLITDLAKQLASLDGVEEFEIEILEGGLHEK